MKLKDLVVKCLSSKTFSLKPFDTLTCELKDCSYPPTGRAETFNIIEHRIESVLLCASHQKGLQRILDGLKDDTEKGL